MRVVIPALVGPGDAPIGGTGANVNALVRRLRDRGHRVRVLGYGPPDSASEEFTPLFDRARPRGRDLALALWRRRGIWDFPADTVVSVHRPDHGLGFLKGPWPLVVTFHGVHRREVARARGPAASWVYGALTRRVMNRADALIFTTGFDRREVTGGRDDWEGRTHTIPTGVDRARFRPGDRTEARRRLGLPEDVFAVGFVGRLAPEKNIPVLVEAVRLMSGAELWLAGDGPLAGSLSRGAGSRVRMMGVLRDDLPVFYTACDVIALASLYEGHPTVIPEAWASGRPVVAPRVTGLGDLLASGGGVLAATPGVDDLVAALRSCRLGIESGASGFVESVLRERSEPLDWDRIVDATVDVYTESKERRCAS